MSAILGVFGAAVPQDDAAVRAILAPMARRGADHVAIWRDGGALLAVSRFGWELGPSCSGAAMLVEDGDLVIAADAALYYRDDLRAAVRDLPHTVGSDTPGHLILAAYRAWGADAVARLEGDFAFIIYDRASRRVLCARDFAGRRPLYHADTADTLVVASTIGGVRAHPAVPQDLNLTVIAETAGAMFAASHETAFRSIHSLRAGWVLTRTGSRTTTAPYWEPPPVDASGTHSFEEGAEELRELLVRAVAERLDSSAPTSVWLSGGWDSPAVFAAGEEACRRRGRGESLRAVSMSYPPGDSGREDELIDAVLARWNRSTHWIDIGQVPFLEDPAHAAATRDEPFAHAFEHWTRALARGSRAVGSNVALDGTGGDLIFSASLLYLADLLREGRWAELRREWSAKGLSGADARKVFEILLHPLLPDWARRAGRALRPHRAWSGAFDAHVPDWIDPGFSRRNDLLDRARRSATPPRARRLADAELEHLLTHPTGPRLVNSYVGLALEEGVDVRSPLYDERLVRFAAARPLAERTSGNETKRLLRSACAGWLPEDFLAPRPHRTGGTGNYAHRALRGEHARFIGDVLRRPVLAEYGIVRPDVLAWRWEEFLNGISRYELPLYLTFQTELWLRAQLASQPGYGAAPPIAARACA
jgi:asparagine synthase (glutamine-hydrolysing)